MNDYPGKPGRKPLGLKQWPGLLFPDQIAALREEGETRGKGQGNAVLRDVIDFWRDHRLQYRAWLAARAASPREQQP